MRDFSLGLSTALVLGMACVGSLPTSLHAADMPVDGGEADRKGKWEKECLCNNLESLKVELANALHLQEAFLKKIPDLRALNHDTSQNAEKIFAEEEMRRVPLPPGYTGPEVADLELYGEQFTYEIEDIKSGKRKLTKSRSDRFCQPDDVSVINLKRTEEGSVCKGIARAIRAHEEHHYAFCRTIGFVKYIGMHGADRAQEEAEAYGVQIAVLRAEIAQLHWGRNCDYRPENPGVTGFNITGIKCKGPEGEWKFETQTDVGSHHSDGKVVVHLDKETLEGDITETYATLHPSKSCTSIMKGRAKFVGDEEPRIERLGLESFSDSCGSNWEPPSSLVTSTFFPLEVGEFCEQ